MRKTYPPQGLVRDDRSKLIVSIKGSQPRQLFPHLVGDIGISGILVDIIELMRIFLKVEQFPISIIVEIDELISIGPDPKMLLHVMPSIRIFIIVIVD